jgi:hypothetical protein
MRVDSERWQRPCRKQLRYAGKEDPKTRTHGSPTGQKALHAGRCIRKRGDGTHSKGQTRRPLQQASHCDRTVQSAAGRGETETTKSRAGQFDHAQTGGQRPEKRRCQEDDEALRQAIPSYDAGAEERGPIRSVPPVVVQAGEECRGQKENWRSQKEDRLGETKAYRKIRALAPFHGASNLAMSRWNPPVAVLSHGATNRRARRNVF